MQVKKSLQKLPKYKQKIDKLFKQKVIERSALDNITKIEKKYLVEQLNHKVSTLKDVELDEFFKQTEFLVIEETKNQRWERNHSNIVLVIGVLIEENGRMPAVKDIALKTGLSRQTIDKHLKDYQSNSMYLGQVEQFKLMTSKVLAKVLQSAIRGDVRACKIYLDAMNGGNGTAISPNNTLIQNQNNFIQINGMVLSQERIQNLKPEQLLIIEEMLKTMG